MSMTIEQKIRQSKFRSEYHRLLANIAYNYLRIHAEQQALLKEFRITFQQFNVLSILRGQHPKACSVMLIRERMLDRSSDVSRIIDRLLRKKLVRRNTCAQDRRQVDIVITNEGLNLLASIDHQADRIDHSVSRISIDEARRLNELLDKLEK